MAESESASLTGPRARTATRREGTQTARRPARGPTTPTERGRGRSGADLRPHSHRPATTHADESDHQHREEQPGQRRRTTKTTPQRHRHRQRTTQWCRQAYERYEPTRVVVHCHQTRIDVPWHAPLVWPRVAPACAWPHRATSPPLRPRRSRGVADEVGPRRHRTTLVCGLAARRGNCSEVVSLPIDPSQVASHSVNLAVTARRPCPVWI